MVKRQPLSIGEWCVILSGALAASLTAGLIAFFTGWQMPVVAGVSVLMAVLFIGSFLKKRAAQGSAGQIHDAEWEESGKHSAA